MQDTLDLALGGSPVARRILAEAGTALGQALANVCTMIDPGPVVIGGPLEPIGDLLLAPLLPELPQLGLQIVRNALLHVGLCP